MVLINISGKQSFDDQLLRYMRERNANKVKEILKNHEPGYLIDSSQSTLLHYAAKYGTTDLIRYLVNAGCNVNAQDERGKTPLMLAIEESHECTVKDLLDCDANLYVSDNQGKSALQLACNTKICRSAKIVEMCVARVGEQYGNDNEKIAKILMEGNCPLYFAMHVKNSAVTKILIDHHGLSINSRDPATGETALHVAAKLADVENVKMLVECGADVNAKDRFRHMPLFGVKGRLINTNEHLKIFKILLDGGLLITEWDVRHLALLDEQFIDLLYDYDFDFLARNEDNSTILHFLAFAKSVDFHRLKGKKLHVNARDRYGYTALQLAFARNNEKLVDFLLDKGATIDYPNEELLRYLIPERKETMFVFSNGTPEFVKTLMKYDEGINFVLKHEMTVFEYYLKENDVMTKFVLALLAILDDSGTQISDYIWNMINDNIEFKMRYVMCKAELAVMKHFTVYESITLFELLTENKKKIEPYMRNEKLVEKYTELVRNFDSNSYYAQVLKKRVEKAIKITELKKVALSTFCELVGLNMDAGCIITENMFPYLDELDLENFVESHI